ncbi:hypothetical protein L1286_02955 [Pseudoalteromonas sp. SMS1]|nr:hypothetical protein [Pseudoalteromonas sp. SMS1]
MSKETKRKVFEPFYTSCRNAGGTRFGMHIVYNIVTQKLGGEIHCHGVLDEGPVHHYPASKNREKTVKALWANPH